LVWFCVPGVGNWALIAAGTALALALVLLALWLALCANACDFQILIWQVALVCGIVAIYLSGCCPWLLWLGLGLVLLSAIFYATWVSSCNPQVCIQLRELTAAFSIGAGTALDYLAHIASACGLGIVSLVVSGIALFLTGLTLLLCVRPGPGAGPNSSPQMLRRASTKGGCGC
jgi:hypothetical protein